MLYKRFIYLLIVVFIKFAASINASVDYSIVFIHIGEKIPPYAATALMQARKFNQDCPIILIAEENALKALPFDSSTNITYVACESLVKTPQHKRFMEQTTLSDKKRGGFWRYTSERFLYLNDLMTDYDLKNIFHLEYDNMLYVDLGELLPIFSDQYNGIAATFDNDKRCIPGFVFIPNLEVMNRLAICFADYADKGYNDMALLGIFKDDYGSDNIDALPIIHENYVSTRPLVSRKGHTVQDKNKYCQNIDLFQSIFDAAALGQYLGGADPANGPSKPGFINESCVFNPSLLTFEWIYDEQGRRVPYATFENKRYRINNLHIHSKKLEWFL